MLKDLDSFDEGSAIGSFDFSASDLDAALLDAAILDASAVGNVGMGLGLQLGPEEPLRRAYSSVAYNPANARFSIEMWLDDVRRSTGNTRVGTPAAALYSSALAEEVDVLARKRHLSSAFAEGSEDGFSYYHQVENSGFELATVDAAIGRTDEHEDARYMPRPRLGDVVVVVAGEETTSGTPGPNSLFGE